MKITAFMQVRNEVDTGHLVRFFKWNAELFDHIVAFDDASSDGSADFLENNVDLLIRSEYCSFSSELANKKRLLIEAKKLFPETDWFLWLDADEVLFTSRGQIEEVLVRAEEGNFDGVSFPLTNLWRDEAFYRTDSLYDSLTNVRLWKNSEDLRFEVEPGLHKLLHPKGINRILAQNEFHVTHFGFASKNLIARKFSYYRSLGQQGSNLWRLIDERELTLEHVSARASKLGSRYAQYRDALASSELPPSKISFTEYLAIADLVDKEIPAIKPFVTIVCLIYRGVDWLEFQYSELLALRKELGPQEVEILFVANDASQEVLDFLSQNNIPHVIAPGKLGADEWYINSVYRGYNFGAEIAKGRYLLFVNSDMAYAPGFLHAMLQESAEDRYVSAKLVESGRLKPAEIAIKKNFGKTLRRFRRKSFYKFAERIQGSEVQEGGLYMPAIVARDRFLGCGGFPEGNISAESISGYILGESFSVAKLGSNLVSGDDAFIRKFRAQGGLHLTTSSAIVYHFQEGEKSSSRISSNNKVPSGIAILNDQLIGINGELTLWNYLIDDLALRDVKVIPIPLGVNQKVPYRVSRSQLWRKPAARLVFRNATFLRRLRGPWHQLVLLQDKVTNVRLNRFQRIALKVADARVTNSTESFSLLNLEPSKRNYLLPVPVHPFWQDAPIGDNNGKHFDAIFVGAFNETKGWEDVKNLIYRFPQCKFLLVSKYSDDNPGFHNSIQPSNVLIERCLQTEELLALVDQARIFVVGSPFETQCLAAMEAAFRNLVICMKNTGLLSQLPFHVRDQIGVFHSDLSVAFEEILQRASASSTAFAPAEAMKNAGLDTFDLREKWMQMILGELEQTFKIEVSPSISRRIKNWIPNKYKESVKRRFRK